MGKQLKHSPLVYVIMQVSIGPILSMLTKYISELQDQVRKEFPDSSKIPVQVYNFNRSQIQIKALEQWHFTDKQKTTGIIVDENNFFIHTTNYTTCSDLLDKFVGTLDKFNTVLNGFTYNKLGLRYVNLIGSSDDNMKKQFLGFNLSGQNQVKDEYISKTETLQKTEQGAIRVRATTFNDKIEYAINKCLPPDLLETANRLFIPESANKLFTSKFTVLDLDHYMSSNLMDFHSNHIMDSFKGLHNIIEKVFDAATTSAAKKEWS